MKSVQWVLIASRIFVLSCGLTVIGGGCGDNATVTSGPTGGLSPEEVKRNDDSKKAMEEAAKPAKKK
jgi:hypothetical protein